MRQVIFEEEAMKFRAFYDENLARHTDAVSAFRNILQLLLINRAELLTVTGRVKDRDECLSKFRRKYLKNLEASGEKYEIKSFISDLVGLRVVCLYENDVRAIRDAIKTEFEIIEETDKTAAIEAHDDTFGYKGVHLDLKLMAPRANLPEYSRFRELCFELQIRTTIQDAWSVLDHKIKYKKNIPELLRRRINRLAALFELADQEFLNIRDETLGYEKKTSAMMGTPTVGHAPMSLDLGLDVFTFLALVQRRFTGYTFDDLRADALVTEILAVNPQIGAVSLDEMLSAHMPTVEKYRAYQSTLGNNLNPLTSIRHALFLADRTKHRALLFTSQRANFEVWLAQGN